jgi:hypothetical protein
MAQHSAAETAEIVRTALRASSRHTAAGENPNQNVRAELHTLHNRNPRRHENVVRRLGLIGQRPGDGVPQWQRLYRVDLDVLRMENVVQGLDEDRLVTRLGVVGEVGLGAGGGDVRAAQGRGQGGRPVVALLDWGVVRVLDRELKSTYVLQLCVNISHKRRHMA